MHSAHPTGRGGWRGPGFGFRIFPSAAVHSHPGSGGHVFMHAGHDSLAELLVTWRQYNT